MSVFSFLQLADIRRWHYQTLIGLAAELRQASSSGLWDNSRGLMVPWGWKNSTCFMVPWG
jgi:aminoglycoside phosphotransferase (APT) family kinase protein